MTNDSPARSLSLALPFFSLSLLAVLLLSLSDGLISCYVCWSFLLSLSFARRSLAPFSSREWTEEANEAEGRKEGRKCDRASGCLRFTYPSCGRWRNKARGRLCKSCSVVVKQNCGRKYNAMWVGRSISAGHCAGVCQLPPFPFYPAEMQEQDVSLLRTRGRVRVPYVPGLRVS